MGANNSTNKKSDCSVNHSSFSNTSSSNISSNNKEMHNFESLSLNSTYYSSNSSNSPQYTSLSSQNSKISNISDNNTTVLSILSSNTFLTDIKDNNNINNIQNIQNIKNINKKNKKKNIKNINNKLNDNETPLILNDLISETPTSTIYTAKFEGKSCVVKCIKRTNKRAKQLFINEYNALKVLKHQNIIKSYGITKDAEYYYLILDEGDTDLADFRGDYKLTEKHVSILIKNILNGLKYMHNNNICHRDLKPENILIKNNDYFNPIIIDFGECLNVKNDLFYKNLLIGTANYLSPERLLFDNLNGNMFKSSDIWSIGIICYELITGKHCFNGKNNDIIYDKILANKWQWPKNYKVSKLCKDFVSKCLEYDASKRMSIDKALNHPFLFT